MHNFGRGRLALSALVALALTGFAAGCGGDDGDDGSSGPVELTIATFNEFGYEGLIEEWNAAHPDIQVTQKKVGTWDDAKDNLYTSWRRARACPTSRPSRATPCPRSWPSPTEFIDLTDPALDGRWLDWKQAAGTDADGQLISYGTDIGPEGITTSPTCSRRPASRPTGPRSPRCWAPGTTTSPRASSSSPR